MLWFFCHVPATGAQEETATTPPREQEEDAAGDEAAPPPREVTSLFAGRFELLSEAGSDDVRVYLAQDGLELRRGDLEMRSQSAVLWIDAHRLREWLELPGAGDPLRAGPAVPPTPGRSPLSDARSYYGDRTLPYVQALREIYLEGNVIWRRGEEATLFADQLYHHFLEDRGVLRHASMLIQQRDPEKDRHYHLQMRAETMRALGPMRFEAEDVEISTCTFSHPHYHVLSGTASFVQEPPGETGGEVTLQGNRFAVHGIELLPLPPFSIDLDQRESVPLRSARAGKSSRYGAFLQTEWGAALDGLGTRVHEQLGIEGPFQGDWMLRLDGMSERGAALGPGLEYGSPGRYEGLLETYFLRDAADEDRSRLSTAQPGGMDDPFRFDIDQPDRARLVTQNRFTPHRDWRIDAEAGYYSDESFQREFFEREFKEGKEPESYVHVVRQVETTRFRGLYRNRLNDFDTQLDSLPSVSFEQIAYPLFRMPWASDERPSHLELSHLTEVAHLRRHPAEDVATPSARLLRGDSLVELATSLQIGPVGLQPFAAGRFTGYTENARTTANVGRALGLAGARLQLPIHRTFQSNVDALSINGLRHVAIFDVGYENYYSSSRAPEDLIQLDAVDAQDLSQRYVLGVRQRLQTWREDEIVDFVELDVELPLYPKEDRDNPVRADQDGAPVGRSAGPLVLDLVYRPGLTADWLQNSVVTLESEWNLQDQTFDVFNAGLGVSPSSRWNTHVRYRSVRDRSRVLTGILDYQLAEKWAVAFLNQYDLRDDRALEQRVLLRHFGHDFQVDFEFERDEGERDTSFSISLRPIFFGQPRESDFFDGRGASPELDPELY